MAHTKQQKDFVLWNTQRQRLLSQFNATSGVSLKILCPRERRVFQSKLVWNPGQVWACTKHLASPGFDPRTVQPVVSRYTD
jgi:hypothetical protein